MKSKNIILLFPYFFKLIKCNENDLPHGFTHLNENIKNGPITINRNLDDGSKRNLFSMIKSNDDSFYYKYDEFKQLESIIPKNPEYICEDYSGIRPEAQKGHDISCPKYYTIKIDKAFYGRYANDKNHCKMNSEIKSKIKKRNKKRIKIKNDCGNDVKENIKEKCEGKIYCSLISSDRFFGNSCPNTYKYLYIEYRCIKDLELKKEKIGIVSFYNSIKSNSIQEHSVSEFYQYAKIHNYDFQLNYINYSPDREIYFMKLYNIIEKIIEGLKYKKYDWLLWVDSDVVIFNPNIKLEAFLPDEKMNKVHLIAAYDYLGRKNYCCGLNSGVFFIRVHEWSLNLLIRAISYPYFNTEKELYFPEQISLNNILIESNEFEHFRIVPEQWFNIRYIKSGSFLLHIMGGPNDEKIEYFKRIINNTENEEIWNSKINEEIRKEVLKYYNLPRENQKNIKIQP